MQLSESLKFVIVGRLVKVLNFCRSKILVSLDSSLQVSNVMYLLSTTASVISTESAASHSTSGGPQIPDLTFILAL